MAAQGYSRGAHIERLNPLSGVGYMGTDMVYRMAATWPHGRESLTRQLLRFLLFDFF